MIFLVFIILTNANIGAKGEFKKVNPSKELGLTPDKSSCTRKIKAEAITAITALFAGFLPGSKPVSRRYLAIIKRLQFGNELKLMK